MAKSKAIIRIDSYGIYSIWDSESKKLPKIQQFTLDIPAEIDMEFGFSVNIKKPKVKKYAIAFTTLILLMLTVRSCPLLMANCIYVTTIGIFT